MVPTSTFPSVPTGTDLRVILVSILNVVEVFLGLVDVFFLGFFAGSKPVFSDEELEDEDEKDDLKAQYVSLLCH